VKSKLVSRGVIELKIGDEAFAKVWGRVRKKDPRKKWIRLQKTSKNGSISQKKGRDNSGTQEGNRAVQRQQATASWRRSKRISRTGETSERTKREYRKTLSSRIAGIKKVRKGKVQSWVVRFAGQQGKLRVSCSSSGIENRQANKKKKTGGVKREGFHLY